ncbi:hypothetical protein MIR68_003756 [Amoeboaphelidium protococcarum]|nr:hypothetical protein MIR68_003756 [Amoeboaphelidium protococcarum]
MVREVIAELKQKEAVLVGVSWTTVSIELQRSKILLSIAYCLCQRTVLSINDYELMNYLVPGKLVRDYVKYISNHEGQLWALKTDSYQVQFVFKCPDEYVFKEISVMNCIDVVRVDPSGNGQIQLPEDFNATHEYKDIGQDELGGDNDDFEFEYEFDGELEFTKAPHSSLFLLPLSYLTSHRIEMAKNVTRKFKLKTVLNLSDTDKERLRICSDQGVIAYTNEASDLQRKARNTDLSQVVVGDLLWKTVGMQNKG